MRTVEEGIEVARAARSARAPNLVGVSGYEGVAGHGPGERDLNPVDDSSIPCLRCTTGLAGSTRAFQAGSSCARVPTLLTTTATALTPAKRMSGPVFHSAMHGWARLVSRPEQSRALLDAGRRDLPFDEGLPKPQGGRRTAASGASEPLAERLDDARLFALKNQHGYVELPADSTLAVGDIVRLGLSHPCTAFDKWTLISVLDDANSPQPKVVDLMRTFF